LTMVVVICHAIRQFLLKTSPFQWINDVCQILLTVQDKKYNLLKDKV
jgi:uncharacterized membrane protein YdbT with pleckstrin-like domain